MADVVVTIDEPIIGFRGVRTRWWDRSQERRFPDWQTAGTEAEARQEALL